MRLPDILEQLFPPSQLLQLDQVHLMCLGGALRDRLRLLVLAQNTRDTAGRISLRLVPTVGRHALAASIRPLRIEIGPAAVLMARLELPLNPLPQAAAVRLLIKGSAPIRAGNVVRPQRHAPVHRRVRPPFAAGMPLWPRRPSLRHWMLHGRPSVRLTLPTLHPADTGDPLRCPSGWQVGELWTYQDPDDAHELADRIRLAMGEIPCPSLRLGPGAASQPSGVLKASP